MNTLLQKSIFKNSKGFTLIELLMVILLISILAIIGITQFTNFAKDAKDNATKANLQVLRKAIATQNAQMRIRCGITTANAPLLADLNANDITSTNGATSPPVGGCNTAQITSLADRKFVAGNLPGNPWGPAQSNAIVQADATAIGDHSLNCADHAARTGANDGWCYDVATGDIWANSANNSGTAGTGTESTY